MLKSFHLNSFMWSQDVAGEIAAELQGYPDFIIGNYSDGNLVASLLACKMGVTQVLFFLFFSLTLPWKCESHAIYYLYWNLIDLNVHIYSAQLPMHWRKQSIQIRVRIGGSLMINTIFHVSSLLI
jgi:hypothetical protein